MFLATNVSRLEGSLRKPVEPIPTSPNRRLEAEPWTVFLGNGRSGSNGRVSASLLQKPSEASRTIVLIAR